jgi:hypothetical protein
MHELLIGFAVIFVLGMIFGLVKGLYWRGGSRRR